MKNAESKRSRIFIELYRYKTAWAELNERERIEYIEKVIGNVGRLAGFGITVIGYGHNDSSTTQRAPYDFFCVYLIPDNETQRVFENEIDKSGWYGFFDQINVSGEATSYVDLLSSHATDETL
ncbi:DUF6616 family protein [Cupriavidus oxalaticus]|uniref:DUF6616 family protein n=1 Tax=Cupriavidus oxalaticus TaxID=96344 RepID=UPI00317AA971